MSDQPIVFEEWTTGDDALIAVARLNTPKALNSLSLEMIRLLTPQLKRWAEDDRIRAVWLEAEGDKAFCAGGDIVALYRSMTEPQGASEGEAFFTEEYELDYLIHTFPKPVVCWGHGIVMGGGMGILEGASHRVVTESSKLAMPEITIGLYPDVAAGWFLNRTPGRTGLFLGLTGARMNGADALFTGLADRFIKHELKAGVVTELRQRKWQGEDAHAVVGSVLRQFEQQSAEAMPESPVRTHFDEINRVTDADSLVAVVSQLKELSGGDGWVAKATKSLASASPTSLTLVWHHLHNCKHDGLKEVLDKELVLSQKCLSKGEFAEGIRALLIDKDQQPRWRYASLAEMDSAWIDDFFKP
ncbi:enoyl-CoA hydratase/isomerase family protein [Marinobacter sp. M216]|uniref:3-hydroxyisobutyryl-CoA hydrolase n=1 Tax=Marinobacter albus TaxID=3030833 RepID=A0ABT7HFL3_9GAMM|nr:MULTISPECIES: enoyl-CoA hydratase/isomerase family protein [unclassified Marinobacter]MBW7472615.1 enoyl-CoA hydratase/isomerase family protein [Marinobacter sp. F4218]MDK9559168.1 enoyl-CoA hydratase/isomerase family protein [Marinobacter sp. M216]